MTSDDREPAPPPNMSPSTMGLLRVSARYGVAALAVSLAARAAAGGGLLSGAQLSWIVFVLVAGYPVTLAAGWLRTGRAADREDSYDAWAGRGGLLRGAGGAVLLAIAAWIGSWPVSRDTEEPRPVGDAPLPHVVVLPLLDLDGTGDRYFEDGVTDEIVAGLAAVEGLEVRGRVSAGEFLDVNRDAARIGRRLGAAVTLDGTVRRAMGRVRLTVRLVDVRTGAPMWSMSRDTTLDAVFTLRDGVVRGVAAALDVEPTDETHRRLGRRRTSREALDLYMLGRFRWGRAAGGDLAEAVSYHLMAIDADSTFVPAWTALADAYATLPRFSRFPVERSRRDGAAAARTALRLEPDTPGAHAALGEILYLYERDDDAARSHLDRAVQLDPGDAAPRERLCELAATLGEIEAARDACASARERDPRSFRVLWTTALLDRVEGRGRAAASRLDSLASSHPDFEPLAADAAIAHLADGQAGSAAADALAHWLALLGATDAADSLAERIVAGAGADEASADVRAALVRVEEQLRPAPEHLAALLVLSGEGERALDVAIGALADRLPGALRFGVFPEYSALRKRASFRRALAAAGLPSGVPAAEDSAAVR